MQIGTIPARWDILLVELATFILGMLGAAWKVAGVLGRIEGKVGRLEERLNGIEYRLMRMEQTIAAPPHMG